MSQQAVSALILSAGDEDAAARTLYGEARGEPIMGQIAVMWVIRNRAADPAWWGRSIEDVCRHPYQFSCWNMADRNRLKITSLENDSQEYRNMLHIVRMVADGLVADPTGVATHYKVTGTKASWDGSVERLGIAPVVIGSHEFYHLGPSA